MRRSWRSRALALAMGLSMAVPAHAAEPVLTETEGIAPVLAERAAADGAGARNGEARPAPTDSEAILTGQEELGEGHIASVFDAPLSAVEREELWELGTLPASYDARTEAGIDLPVKNQFGNTCWAHGISFAAEASVLKHRLISGATAANTDFSERALIMVSENSQKYAYLDPLQNSVGEYAKDPRTMTTPTFYSFGESRDVSLPNYFRWQGPISEYLEDGSKNPETHADYVPVSGSDDISEKYGVPGGKHVVAHLEEALFINPEDRDVIKKYILRDGAVDCSYFSETEPSYLGADKKSLYCPTAEDANHEVALIGWDDNYSKEQFDCLPESMPSEDGAWLMRNSWGTDQGDKGYFWISYEDKSLKDITALHFGSRDNYDHNYYYLGTFFQNSSYRSGSTLATVYTARVSDPTLAAQAYKTAGTAQVLRAVGLGIGSSDVAYELKIYKGTPDALSENPVQGEAAATASGTLGCAGLHTISLDQAVPLTAGDGFSIVLKLTSSDGSPVKVFSELYQENLTLNQHAGEALLLEAGTSSWRDLSDPGRNGSNALNFAISAYTDNTAAEVLSVTSVSSSDGKASWNPVKKEVMADFTTDAREGESIADHATTNFGLTYSDPNFVPETVRSGNDSIVSVTGSGREARLTARGAGTTTVSISGGSGGTTKSATITVTVMKQFKPEWFAYTQKSKTYQPGGVEIELYEGAFQTASTTAFPLLTNDITGYTLLPADAYDVTYENNKQAGSATATITFGDFPSSSCYYAADDAGGTSGSVALPFQIGTCDASTLKPVFTEGGLNLETGRYEFSYTGNAIRPIISHLADATLTVKHSCTQGSYYRTPSLSNPVTPLEAGIYYAAVQVDKESYTGWAAGTDGYLFYPFEITPVSLSAMKVSYSNSATYTGSAIEPRVLLYHEPKGYKNYLPATSFTVEYHNNINAYDLAAANLSDAEAAERAPYFTIRSVSGGNYQGSVSNGNAADAKYWDRFYFSIAPMDLSEASVRLDKEAWTFTGKRIRPVASVSCGDFILKEGRDYEVSYRKNLYPGQGEVVVTGLGNYTGSFARTFSIEQADGAAQVKVALKSPKAAASTYTGKAVKPAVTVTDANGRKLSASAYKVSYYHVEDPGDKETEDPIDVGTWGIAVAPKGATTSFAVNAGTTFTIGPKPAKSVKITLKNKTFSQGRGQSQEDYLKEVQAGKEAGIASVRDGSKALAEKTDYTVSYFNNTDCGTATARLTFTGNYTGTRDVLYQIRGTKLSTLRFGKLAAAEVVLGSDGNAVETMPAVSITDRSGNAVDNAKGENDNYALYYHNAAAVGRATVLIVGRGIYEGTKALTWQITPRRLDKREIQVTLGSTPDRIEDQTYSGSPVTLKKLTVTDVKGYYDDASSKEEPLTLKEGTDYTIKYANNRKAGTARVTITGKGNYKGSVTRTFAIVDNWSKLGQTRDLTEMAKTRAFSLQVDNRDYYLKDGKWVSEDSMGKESALTLGYTGKAQTLALTLFDNTKPEGSTEESVSVLQEGKDYKLTYRNNTKASARPDGTHIEGRQAPTVVIRGLAPNYIGTLEVPFEITQILFDSDHIKPLWTEKGAFAEAGAAPEAAYASTLKPILYYLPDGYEHSRFAVEGTRDITTLLDVKLENVSKIAPAGEKGPAMVIAPDKRTTDGFVVRNASGSYEDASNTSKLEYRFSIVAADLANATIAPVAPQTLRSRAVQPKPAVTLGSSKLKEGVDFNYVYVGTTAPGIGSVQIEGVDGNATYFLGGTSPSAQFLIK